jgi:hypothetical protein
MASEQLLQQYYTHYEHYQLAASTAANGDGTTARRLLQDSSKEVDQLLHGPNRTALDNKLKHTLLPAQMPHSVAALNLLITTKLDELDGLHHPTPTTVLSFANFKGSQPTHMELLAGKAYVIDTGSKPAIYIANLTTRTAKASAANASALTNVVATTLSSSNDGLYILTSKPSVWFYQFDTDTLKEQTINLSSWPSGSAIASYSGNLYILSGSTIYKHSRTLTGFAPKTESLTVDQAAGLRGASSLAVDGSIYALSTTGLFQYLAGSLRQTATTPAKLAGAPMLRAIGSRTIMAVAPQTNRIGFWDVKQSSLVFSTQYQLEGVKALKDASYDAATETIYALADNRLVQVSR